MTPAEVFDKTDDITHDFVGVFLGGDIRTKQDRWGGWQAYLVKYNGKGNVASVRMLRTKSGKPVRTSCWWEGKGHLIERIEKLNKEKQIKP